MSNEKLLAALPLAAILAAMMMHTSAARAAGQDGLVAVRDPQTGQMRAPTAAEMKALAPAPAANVSSPVPLSSLVVTKPNGSRTLRLAGRNQVYAVVSRAPDGQLVEQCVQGESAVGAALAQPATPRNNQEHRHEDR
jgi:hypothetical protein